MTKSITPKNIVIYADDDQDDLELVNEAFENYLQNVKLVTFTDGDQVLQYLTQLSNLNSIPCLIILDINMPLVNGKEVLIQLRNMEHFNSVPVVFFTTSSLPQDKVFAERYNAGFITKPIDVRQMKIITGQFIDHCAEDVRRSIRGKL